MTGLPVDHRKIFVDWVRNRLVISLACVSVSRREFTVLCSFNTPRQIVLGSPPGRPAAGHPSCSSQEFLLRLLLLHKGRSLFRRNHHPFQWSRYRCPLPRSRRLLRPSRCLLYLNHCPPRQRSLCLLQPSRCLRPRRRFRLHPIRGLLQRTTPQRKQTVFRRRQQQVLTAAPTPRTYSQHFLR